MAGNPRKPPLGRLALAQRRQLAVEPPLVVGQLVAEHIAPLVVVARIELVAPGIALEEQRILPLGLRTLALGTLPAVALGLGKLAAIVALEPGKLAAVALLVPILEQSTEPVVAAA